MTVWGAERGGKGGGNCMASTPVPFRPYSTDMKQCHSEYTNLDNPQKQNIINGYTHCDIPIPIVTVSKAGHAVSAYSRV